MVQINATDRALVSLLLQSRKASEAERHQASVAARQTGGASCGVRAAPFYSRGTGAARHPELEFPQNAKSLFSDQFVPKIAKLYRTRPNPTESDRIRSSGTTVKRVRPCQGVTRGDSKTREEDVALLRLRVCDVCNAQFPIDVNGQLHKLQVPVAWEDGRLHTDSLRLLTVEICTSCGQRPLNELMPKMQSSARARVEQQS